MLGDRSERRRQDVDGKVPAQGTEQWGVNSVYVSCVSNTRWEALGTIASTHPSVLPQPNTSTERLQELLSEPDQPFVVILDKIGGLEDTDLLIDLASIEWISLICIGHDRRHILS